jgi:hypothetical protein
LQLLFHLIFVLQGLGLSLDLLTKSKCLPPGTISSFPPLNIVAEGSHKAFFYWMIMNFFGEAAIRHCLGSREQPSPGKTIGTPTLDF